MPERANNPYIVWFDDYDEDEHRPLLGGKNASLGEMMSAGLPVPPGFAVTTEAFGILRHRRDLTELVADLRGELDFDRPGALRRASRRIRERIEQLPIPDEVREGVSVSYAALCEQCGQQAVPVAVRSSATAEDLPDASFAGQQDSFLWITGCDEVLEHLRRCWSSVFTDRAMSYRRETGHGADSVDISVGIQKMVEPRAAGVAFTLNPSDGDRSQIAIEAAWGFGEAVVSGEVTPDNYLVDKVLYEIVSRTVSPKTIEYRLDDSGIEKVDLDGERATSPCLTDEEIRAVARMARRAEKHYGRPQDVEWAVDRHLPEGDNVILLQSRPETVWSNRPRRRVGAGKQTGVAGIVSTLVAPVRQQHRTTEEATP